MPKKAEFTAEYWSPAQLADIRRWHREDVPIEFVVKWLGMRYVTPPAFRLFLIREFGIDFNKNEARRRQLRKRLNALHPPMGGGNSHGGGLLDTLPDNRQACLTCGQVFDSPDLSKVSDEDLIDEINRRKI